MVALFLFPQLELILNLFFNKIKTQIYCIIKSGPWGLWGLLWLVAREGCWHVNFIEHIGMVYHQCGNRENTFKKMAAQGTWKFSSPSSAPWSSSQHASTKGVIAKTNCMTSTPVKINLHDNDEKAIIKIMLLNQELSSWLSNFHISGSDPKVVDNSSRIPCGSDLC